MLDTILIGSAAMRTSSQALKVVGNNLSNVNTPGFKGSQLEFASLFEQGANPNQAQGKTMPVGGGVEAIGTTIDFHAGGDLATGNPLHVKINGNGFFTVQRGDQVLYTRDGAFALDDTHKLVNPAGDHVLGLDAAGNLNEISLDGFTNGMPKVTSVVKFSGNLNSALVSPSVNAQVNNVTVYDAQGGPHQLNISFANNGDSTLTVAVTDKSGQTIGTGILKFTAGSVVPDAATIAITVQGGGATFPVTLDFSGNVTSISSVNSIAFGSQDGWPTGELVGESITADGYLSLQYSNGQTRQGPRLALADFDTASQLVDAGASMFKAAEGTPPTYGYAGEGAFGKLLSGHREGSNVDLSTEFSNLILMQRGYQAASHVISVANDMIQELFDMKGHR